jgi:RNA polymerase sigma factor (sigma-70 family)
MNDPDVATTGPAGATAGPTVTGPTVTGPTVTGPAGGGPVMGDFESWYRDAHPRLVATLLLVTGDLGLAADSVDEAFARALERWDRVRSMASPTGWTFRVARNVSRRSLRRSALERRLLARSPRPADVPAPAGEIWRIVSDLPLRQREVVVLRHVADLPEAEIAETLGITRSTVSSTLRDAHARLGRLLDEPTDHDQPASRKEPDA